MEKRSDEYRLSKAALTRMAQRQWSSQIVDKKSWLNWSFNQNFQKLKKKSSKHYILHFYKKKMQSLKIGRKERLTAMKDKMS